MLAAAAVAVLGWDVLHVESSVRLSTETLMAIGWYVDPVSSGTAMTAVPRCEWVVQQVQQHDHGKPPSKLRQQYATEASDVNSFYRGTAFLFWEDFVNGGWGPFDLSALGVPTTQADGTPLQRESTWTWITGDQHLSNFGAWKNRNNNVIFGVNDFDEATIFDFQIDVWRCSVSIYDHAISNGLGEAKATAAVLTFTDSYLSTLQAYVGNEKALLFEMTQRAATGKLADFLSKVLTLTLNSKP